MRTFATATLAVLAMSGTAFAQADDLRFSDLASIPAIRSQMLDKTKDQEPWVRMLVEKGGVEGPAQSFMIDGVPYTYASTCRPHMCADYELAVLTGPQQDVHLYIHGDGVRNTPIGTMPPLVEGRFRQETMRR